MSEHPRVTYEDGEKTISVDSSRVIFLLVSDVGAEGINAAVLRYRNRADVVAVSDCLVSGFPSALLAFDLDRGLREHESNARVFLIAAWLTLQVAWGR